MAIILANKTWHRRLPIKMIDKNRIEFEQNHQIFLDSKTNKQKKKIT